MIGDEEYCGFLPACRSAGGELALGLDVTVFYRCLEFDCLNAHAPKLSEWGWPMPTGRNSSYSGDRENGRGDMGLQEQDTCLKSTYTTKRTKTEDLLTYPSKKIGKEPTPRHADCVRNSISRHGGC